VRGRPESGSEADEMGPRGGSLPRSRGRGPSRHSLQRAAEHQRTARSRRAPDVRSHELRTARQGLGPPTGTRETPESAPSLPAFTSSSFRWAGSRSCGGSSSRRRQSTKGSRYGRESPTVCLTGSTPGSADRGCREAGIPGRVPHDMRRSAVRSMEFAASRGRWRCSRPAWGRRAATAATGS